MRDFIANWGHDALVAWLGLVRRPFYAVATIVMLALAIGACGTAFGVFYGVTVGRLPYAQAGRLVMMRERIPKVGLNGPMVAPRDYARMITTVPGIASAGMWTFGGEYQSVIAGKPVAVSVSRLTPSWFSTLGVRPVLGRLPGVAAGRPGGPREVMISYKFWQSDYGGRGDVVGRAIKLGKRTDRIVGVLPKDYSFDSGADVLMPLVMPMSRQAMTNINDYMVARLKPGVTVSALNMQITRLKHQILNYRATSAKMKLNDFVLDARPLRGTLVSLTPVSILPQVLQFMALLLLGLAIANAANLAMVRQRGRLADFRLRRVLGATRGMVMRLLLLEQMPILVVTGLVALLVAFVALRAIGAMGLTFDVAPFRVGFSVPVALAVVGLTLVSGLVIVAVPLRLSVRRDLGEVVGQGGRSTISRPARAAQRGLGVVQIILAFALLVGSLALGLSLVAVLNQPLGFKPQHRLVVSVILPAGANDLAGVDALTAQLRNNPMFKAVGGTNLGTFPFSSSRVFSLARREAPGSHSYHANYAEVTQGFFGALGIAMQSGRRFSGTEYHDGAKVMIVGAGFARRLFGTDRVVGRMVNLGGNGENYRIVGVTRPVVWRAAPWQAAPGTMYLPVGSLVFSGSRITDAHLIVDYTGSLGDAVKQSRAIITRAVPGAVVLSARSYQRIFFIHDAFRVIAATIAASFATVALILAGLGVYAVNAFVARARLPEFGMRAMLGASPARLLRHAMTDAAWLLGLGLTGGVVAGYALIRAMSPLLFRIGEIAPIVFALTMAIIALIVLVAAWRPAARAANTRVKTLLDSA